MTIRRASDVPTLARLLVAFLSVSCITAVLGLVAYSRIGRIGDDLDDLFNRHLKGSVALGAANTAEVRLGLQARIASQAKAEEHGAAMLLVNEFAKEVEQRLGEYLSLVDPSERADVQRLIEEQAEYLRRVEHIQTMRGDPSGLESSVARAASQRAVVAGLLEKQIAAERVLAAQGYAQSHALVTGSGSLIAGLTALAVFVGALLGWLVSSSLVKPLALAVAALDRVAAGDLTPRLRLDRGDEIGQLGRALDQALEKIGAALAKVGGQARSLAATSNELSGASQQLGTAAEETSTPAVQVSAGTEEVSASVQTVSASSEEMEATIKEIAKTTSEAATVSQEGDRLAKEATLKVGQLGEVSVEIGAVVKMISRIAEQTSLLALNATIEAARAGESGKGFAVVASEVKELSRETAKAAEDVTRRVQGVQAGASEVAGVIATISTTMSRIAAISTTTAAAIEEQSAAAGEISRNVAHAAEGTKTITANISGVAEAATATAKGAARAMDSARAMDGMAAELRALLAGFQLPEAGAAQSR
jgi:methyl-accepting chemotaxis protein